MAPMSQGQLWSSGVRGRVDIHSSQDLDPRLHSLHARQPGVRLGALLFLAVLGRGVKLCLPFAAEAATVVVIWTDEHASSCSRPAQRQEIPFGHVTERCVYPEPSLTVYIHHVRGQRACCSSSGAGTLLWRVLGVRAVGYCSSPC